MHQAMKANPAPKQKSTDDQNQSNKKSQADAPRFSLPLTAGRFFGNSQLTKTNLNPLKLSHLQTAWLGQDDAALPFWPTETSLYTAPSLDLNCNSVGCEYVEHQQFRYVSNNKQLVDIY